MSINPTLAIAQLAIRSAMHSRVVIWLLACISAVTAVLPFFLRSDGTATGHIKLIISYPFTISFIILTLGTLWLSSGLISQEIASKELQSITTKPIHAFEIWTGKWLALVAINTFLVCSAAIGLTFSTSIITRKHKEAPAATAIREQVLTARHAIAPNPIPDLLEYAELTRQRLIRQHVIPETTSIDRICGEMKSARSMVAPQKEVSWTIPLPPQTKPKTPRMSLRYKFRCNATERRPISGTWIITYSGKKLKDENPTDQKTKEQLTININNITDGTHNLMLPATFNPVGTNITVAFSHIPPSGNSPSPAPTIYFDPDLPVELMIHQGSFAMNALRSTIAVISFLACISAIGLSMSSLFSFPVAAFASLAILFSVALATGFSEEPPELHHHQTEYQSKIVQLTEPAIVFLKHATANITANIPISTLAGGMLFSWKQTFECILLLLLIIPIILGLVSSVILSQKELAV